MATRSFGIQRKNQECKVTLRKNQTCYIIGMCVMVILATKQIINLILI